MKKLKFQAINSGLAVLLIASPIFAFISKTSLLRTVVTGALRFSGYLMIRFRRNGSQTVVSRYLPPTSSS